MKINKIEELTPQKIVGYLDNFIIGQKKAKKFIAIALRNRYRRRRLPEDLRDEVTPKNIIMIGPTGVGKTEIARRISKLTGAPFLKVEATKYTEVGYVGRDVESMIRDLMSGAISMIREEMFERVQPQAKIHAEERVLDILIPKEKNPPAAPVPPSPPGSTNSPENVTEFAARALSLQSDDAPRQKESTNTREYMRTRLRAGELDEKEIEILVAQQSIPQVEIFSGSSFEEVGMNIGHLQELFGQRRKKRRTTVAQALQIFLQEEVKKMTDTDQVTELAKERVEEMGIIFIDEIDKITTTHSREGTDVSREGVQRDILPIVEGCKVNTRYGVVDTSHILFIAAGAFHISKPSDLIPELQGRFPLRVELNTLSTDDFFRILTQPRNALIHQYVELLKTENVTLDFTEEAIREISGIATQANSVNENIGARRLHTVLEILLEDVSFEASELQGQTIPITIEYVHEKLDEVLKDQNLSRYIL